ncbi:protein regulator of cytokinesis 1-like isoform X1 [Monodelphis domestica]|uniref:protein regulator of cytokinesis 1-like isoform X1 n=1 Tax=Monodelphis domestica TaxID=13616 RepID=UPI0024E2756E|nr:protein regulator of cytokinesis 1-like isoform X1 [Monodelphis domestica]
MVEVAATGRNQTGLQPQARRGRSLSWEREHLQTATLSKMLALESMAYLHKALNFLQDLFESVGIPEDQRLERTEVVKSLLDIIISEEETNKKRLLESIALHRKQLDSLCFELNVERFQEEEGITIVQLENDLRLQLEVRSKQKVARMQELRRLQEQDRAFCELFHTPPYSMEWDSVPSLEELDQFRGYLATLAETEAFRQEEFGRAKRQILFLTEELNYTPDSSFEKDILCEDEDISDLSLEKLAALHDLLHQLETLRTENEIVCEELHFQIQKLWDILQVPYEERKALATLMTRSVAKRRKALQSEVDRLEKLRIQNLKKVIEPIRKELALYWGKCFYSQEQRDAFTPYYDEDYTETLLQLHDTEVVQLKHYYEVHRELFEGIQKWEENWKLFLEFERKASDPSRFINRGGNLLKEERQRARLQKTFLKLEEELKAQIDLWEQEHSKTFLVNGQKFMEYVTEQWEMHRLEKEKAKQERHLKKSQQIEVEMFYGSASKIPSKREGLGSKMAGRALKTLNASPQEANRTFELDETILNNGCSQLSPLQRNFQIDSVARTYSAFSQEFSEASKSVDNSEVFNSTNL